MEGLTQQQVGQRVGRSQSIVSQYETGRVTPDDEAKHNYYIASGGLVTANDWLDHEPRPPAPAKAGA